MRRGKNRENYLLAIELIGSTRIRAWIRQVCRATFANYGLRIITPAELNVTESETPHRLVIAKAMLICVAYVDGTRTNMDLKFRWYFCIERLKLEIIRETEFT